MVQDEMTSPAQIRAARALIALSQADLSRLAGVSVSTLKRAEGTIQPPASADAVAALRAALEAAGVEFLPENGGGAGVRLKKRAQGE